jgi:hypothetical protein
LISADLAPLTKPHSVLAQPSPDGDWIYFRRDGVWRISKRTGAEEQVIPGPVGTFSLAGDRIYFDRGFGDYATPEIYLYFLKIRQTRLVSRLEARKAAGISVLPGGHSLLLALHDRQSSEIILARDNGQDLRSEGL